METTYTSLLCCSNAVLGLSSSSTKAEDQGVKMLLLHTGFFQPKFSVTTMSHLFVFSFSCVELIPPTQKVAGEEHSDSVCIFFQWWGPRHAFTGNWCNAAASSKTTHQAKKNITSDNWDQAALCYHCAGVQNSAQALALCTRQGNATLSPSPPALLNTLLQFASSMLTFTRDPLVQRAPCSSFYEVVLLHNSSHKDEARADILLPSLPPRMSAVRHAKPKHPLPTRQQRRAQRAPGEDAWRKTSSWFRTF